MSNIKNSTILVIDDEIENLILIKELLGEFCQKIILQTDPLFALALLQKQTVDIILLDIRMRDIDGYQICQRLKSNPKTQQIPVIFLSSLTATADKVKGFEAGAVDYISKSFQIEEMVVRIESCLKLHHQLQKAQVNTLNMNKLEQGLLTQHELKVLDWYIIKGYSRKQIAQELKASENTIKWHIYNIFKKLAVKNRAELLEKIRQI